LPEGGQAELTIYDVAGKMVSRIAGEFAKGSNKLLIDKRRLGASGVYYYTLKSGEFSATKKMILIE
jgi:hypothetical protein